jgi:photosystem II stability/assembly factor-like uncharacterized protein
MKKIIGLAILFVLALSACGAALSNDVKSDVIGKWISDDETLTLKFTVEPGVYGTYTANGVTLRTEGKTTWVAENVLLGIWENNPKNWRVKIWGDKMELKSDDGQTLAMRRLNPYPKYSGKINISAVNNGLPSNAYIYSIAIDPVTPANIYVGLKDGGLYKSTDGGKNWAAIHTRLPNPATTIFNLAINPAMPTTVYADAFISTDGGESWSQIKGQDLQYDGTTYDSTLTGPVVFDPTTPNTLYAVTLFGRINKSVDGGLHWNLIPTVVSDESLSVDAIAVDPLNSNILYAGTSDKGVYKSADAGATWSAVNHGLTDQKYIGYLMFDPSEPTILYAKPLLSGLFKSADGGANWSATTIGLHDTDTQITILASDPTTPSIQYVVESGLLLRRTASGEDWSKILNEEISNAYIFCLALDSKNSNTLYLGTNKGVFMIQLAE